MEKYIYKAKLDRVVDGDTVDALIDVGFDIWFKKRISRFEKRYVKFKIPRL